MATLVAVIAMTSAGTVAAGPNPPERIAASVELVWATPGDSAERVTFQYRWDEISIRTGPDTSVTGTVAFEVDRHADGAFRLTTTPIAVPLSGATLQFMRVASMHVGGGNQSVLSGAATYRAGFHQNVELIDAVTGEILIRSVDCSSKRAEQPNRLPDLMDRQGNVVDLSRFAGRRVILRVDVYTACSGAAPLRPATPTLTVRRTRGGRIVLPDPQLH